jgi:purine-binding chemotaxis protein CheW
MEPAANSSLHRFLTFRVDAQLYALRSAEVSEVIRVPAVARIPQGPSALLGLANLRGSVLPVASLRTLLNKPIANDPLNERAIVLDIGAPLALVVDSMATLETADAEHIETRKNELSATVAEKLLGSFSFGTDKKIAKILDIHALLESAFTSRSRTERPVRRVNAVTSTELANNNSNTTEVLVTFEVAGQEFALPLAAVQEILPLPAAVTAVASAETSVLGVISVRDSLLPLMSLRGLLGFSAAHTAITPEFATREKVVVMKVAGTHIGLVADRARAIIAAEVAHVDPIPPVLAARTGGESRIKSIYRGDAGRRLISILSPEQLFREDVMQRLVTDHQKQASQAPRTEPVSRSELIFLVFRLGDEEFALPIDAVVEVAQVPLQITRVPKTPKFLEGVINLRGDVLPVVDQRRRFDMPKLLNTEGRKLIVIKMERHRAGLIVDSVSDVLRTSPENIEPPPELTEETTRLVRGVINLQKSNRMVLVLDPTEVLTRAEQSLLDRFAADTNKASV